MAFGRASAMLVTCLLAVDLNAGNTEQIGMRSKSPAATADAPFVAHTPPSLSSALHHSRDEVSRIYAEICALPTMHDRKMAYKELSPSLREDMWLMNIEEFLKKHAELTDQQIGLVLQVAGFFAMGGMDNQDPTVAQVNRDYLDRLSVSSLGYFPRPLAHEAFARLGGEPRLPDVPLEVRQNAPGVQVRNLHASPTVYIGPRPDCNCNISHDFCDSITNPNPQCHADPCLIIDGGWPNCGWGWFQACDGLCGPWRPAP